MISLAELVGIGGVVSIGERRFVVVGHRIAPDGETMGPGYLVVPYPLGFVDAESLSLVPASAVDAVAHSSYADAQGDAYLAEFRRLAEVTTGIPVAEYEASERLLADFAREEASHG